MSVVLVYQSELVTWYCTTAVTNVVVYEEVFSGHSSGGGGMKCWLKLSTL